MQRIDDEQQPSRAERGAAYIEYALLAALIAVVCITGMKFFGEGVSASYSQTTSQIAAVD